MVQRSATLAAEVVRCLLAVRMGVRIGMRGLVWAVVHGRVWTAYQPLYRRLPPRGATVEQIVVNESDGTAVGRRRGVSGWEEQCRGE